MTEANVPQHLSRDRYKVAEAVSLEELCWTPSGVLCDIVLVMSMRCNVRFLNTKSTLELVADEY